MRKTSRGEENGPQEEGVREERRGVDWLSSITRWVH